MPPVVGPLSATAVNEARRLLKDGATIANSSKKLLHRVKSRLQAPRGDIAITTIIEYVDRVDTPSPDVLQALLAILETRVNIQTLQIVHRRLLVIAARHGHIEILQYILATGVDIAPSRQNALTDAVLSGHVPCVDILLSGNISTLTILRALLTTDYVELDKARDIVGILLKFEVQGPFLDYLYLKLCTGNPKDIDSDILTMLEAARDRKGANNDTKTINDRDDLNVYFVIQEQVRTILNYNVVESPVYKTSTTSIQVTELRQPIRNMFGDETIKSSENLVVRLLERYIRGCSTGRGNDTQWPLETVNILLESMPDGAEDVSEYARCVSIAVRFQQTAIFTRLLRDRALPITMLRSLPAELVVKSVKMTVALLDHLNQYYSEDKDYTEIVKSLFIHACEIQLFDEAAKICSRSRAPMSITDVQQYLKFAITSNTNTLVLSELLREANVDEHNLDILWEYILAADDFPDKSACILLRAGYNGPVVARSFLRCVRWKEKFSTLSMILEEWQVLKSYHQRDQFNYCSRTPFSAQHPKITSSNSHELQYFPTLAAALDIAIQRQQLDLCQILLDKNAPLVKDDESLIEQAVIWGANHTSLIDDKVLNLLLEIEKPRADAQNVLDFVLLQAVKHNRSQIVADLIDQGASTLAYNCECWQNVLLQENSGVLQTFLETTHSKTEFLESFETIFGSLTDDLETWLTSSSRIHQAGLNSSKCYSWVLLSLCQRDKITAQSAEQLIVLGAPGQAELDQCLGECWRHGNLTVFEILINKGVSQSAAESLFQSIMRRIATSTIFLCSDDGSPLGRARVEMVLGAMNLLLRMTMPRPLMNIALCNVALLSGEPAPLRTPILISLLERGARFTEDDGLALLHCLLVDDGTLLERINDSQPPQKTRQSALRYALQYPDDRGEPAPSHRFHALNQLLYPLSSTLGLILTDHMIMYITGIFLSPNSNTPTTLIHRYYDWLKHQFPTGLCNAEHCLALEKNLDVIIEGWGNGENRYIQFIERMTEVLSWTRPETDTPTTVAKDFNSFWLPRTSLSRCLLAASRAGITPIVKVLLEIGTSPDISDESGKTALFWASTMNQPDMVKLLTEAGAQINDGSLHEATCLQNHAVMQLLLNSNHSRGHASMFHQNMTPLLAFIYYAHAKSDTSRFPETMIILLENQAITSETSLDMKIAIEFALSTKHAFKLILALLPWLKLCFDTQTAILQLPVFRGPLRYSLLSLVDMWEPNSLTRPQRNSLVLSLQGIGFDELFYTTEGDQPENAVNVPEAILAAEETRKRRIAFETKECCIHGDKAEDEKEIHAGLMPSCATSHDWKNDIVCTECLGQYLEGRMFPHDDVSIKFKFPSTKIPCWAPKCPSKELPYNVLRAHVNPQIFHEYDLALCQALLREGKHMVKCAYPDCPGAHWYDDTDEDDNLKIFFCDVCFENTCTECNDLYEKHDNLPCPAGEETRKSERVKEEEKLSEEALKHEKRCPKCKLMYQKYYGCDHIICGKNVYDNRVDKGCHFEFCNICFGAWPGGHTRTCAYQVHQR